MHNLWSEGIVKYIHFYFLKFDPILVCNHSLTKSRGLFTNMAARGATLPSLAVRQLPCGYAAKVWLVACSFCLALLLLRLRQRTQVALPHLLWPALDSVHFLTYVLENPVESALFIFFIAYGDQHQFLLFAGKTSHFEKYLHIFLKGLLKLQ